MALRGVWIINDGTDGKRLGLLFSRRWLTVERRAKNIAVSSYYSIPPDSELCAAVLSQCSPPPQHLYRSSDTCRSLSSFRSYPVYTLFEDHLWPVVCIQKDKLLLVAIPLCQDSVQLYLSDRQCPIVGTAVHVLDTIAEILGDNVDEHSAKLGDVYQFLSVCLPFGSPLEVSSPSTSHRVQAARTGRTTPAPKVKKAAWQSGSYRGASRLVLTISEEIRANQYDKQSTSDVWDVNGVVQCKADLEGYPDILLTLSTPSDVAPLDHLLTHPCVQAADTEPSWKNSSDQRNRKLRFSPPVGVSFTLAHYSWSSLPFLPIRGFYQMKDDKVVKLLVQLKLHGSMRNNFDYCVVHIPIFNRGPIDKVDNIVPVTLSSSLALSQDRKFIIWTIGQRFPGKGLEVSLQASVHFYEHPIEGYTSNTENDPFCVGANSYVDLFFKLSDFTISNCDIDAKSITLFPSLKYKLITNREVYSSQYRIWNSHGDALFTWPQIKTT